MFRFLETKQNWGLLVLRVCLAALFLYTGIMKAMNLSGTIGFFTSLGFPHPTALTLLVMVCEIAGGLLLLMGLLTRAAAIWLSIILVVAIATVQAQTIGTPQAGNFFKDLALLGGTLALMFTGPGRISLDEVMVLE